MAAIEERLWTKAYDSASQCFHRLAELDVQHRLPMKLGYQRRLTNHFGADCGCIASQQEKLDVRRWRERIS